ncbi:hypothetical protein BGZ97_000952 [Linnemannia gamsii]|jgi:DNA-directed RNA polymerase subunit RPC12/RpoP|uniref:C2H2-type domain-containing protein n=1 Tax=Linnemannia gamsii TaxID=64522 RepID=A0A9P6UJU8_9FUNG|nr:hypothetical protein BGZ97_000952 [Linnemannia gamsii]
MDFSAFLATSSSSDVFATNTKESSTASSVVIITTNNNNNGASTGCFDASKSSKNNNSNNLDTTTTTISSTFPGIYFNNDMYSNNNNDDAALNYYWDHLSADPQDLTGLDLTPELSPELSNYSPAVDSVGSPYIYDPLSNFGDAASPTVEWHSPIEDPLAALNSFEADFDCSFSHEAVWAAQQDFELFPTQKDDSAKLEKLLMDPHPTTIAISALPTIKESPAEATFGAFSPVLSDTVSPALTTFSPQEIICPTTFSEAKLLGQDMQAPNYRVAPRKVTQSPTKVGFQPPKKTRRRRVTSEEASRVIPTEQMGDPNAKPRYKCSECGKTFSRPFNLRSHRDTHSGFRPFECPHKDKSGSKCKWSFARRHDLERHIISKHTKGKNFQCRTCGVECTRSDAFKRHLARNEECNAAEAAADMELDSDQVSHL